MASRRHIERILRDEDDISGDTIRQWHISRENNFITLRKSEGEMFLHLRSEDVPILIEDLKEIAAMRSE